MGYDFGDSKPVLVFSCSGAADTAETADRAARRLHQSGAARMFCLAGIGGGLVPFIDQAKNAGGILAIDGCPQDCAKSALEYHGVTGYRHLRVTDLGMAKGKSPATEERIRTVLDKARPILEGLREAARG